jgi:hypothetical protein
MYIVTIDMELVDRKRGALSKADRRYIVAPDSFNPQASYERRKHIQRRVWNAFLDGSLLVEHATADQRRSIFDGVEELAESVSAAGDDDRPAGFGDVAESRGVFVEKLRADAGFSSWFAFLYLGLSESDEFDFRTTLRAGIERAERARGRRVTGFDFAADTRERREFDELQERFDARRSLTTEEIQRLRAEGVVSGDDLAAYYDDRPAPTSEGDDDTE